MISVIIPVYNQKPKILKKCLDSISRQTYQDFEVIIVDDGSAAPHCVRAEILNSKSEIRNFRIFRQEHKGANAARNYGFRESKGEFLLFCDSDIEMREDMLEKMIKALRENPNVSYAYSSFKYGWKTFRLWPFDAEKLKKMPYIHSTSLIRREHFPGFDDNVKRLQDWDLFLTVAEQGHCGVWISEILFKAYPGGLMSKWLPSFLYRFSFLPWVRKYNEAAEVIRKKHNLNS
jgi:glycosyltransferase involved in cell wall biosynthesis